MQIDLFVLDRLPQSLDEHVVAPGAAPVHADLDSVPLQDLDEARGSELRSLLHSEIWVSVFEACWLWISSSSFPIRLTGFYPAAQSHRAQRGEKEIQWPAIVSASILRLIGTLRRAPTMANQADRTPGGVLVAIDIAKWWNATLIEYPDGRRQRFQFKPRTGRL
jgi:hypothetical protein